MRGFVACVHAMGAEVPRVGKPKYERYFTKRQSAAIVIPRRRTAERVLPSVCYVGVNYTNSKAVKKILNTIDVHGSADVYLDFCNQMV